MVRWVIIQMLLGLLGPLGLIWINYSGLKSKYKFIRQRAKMGLYLIPLILIGASMNLTAVFNNDLHMPVLVPHNMPFEDMSFIEDGIHSIAISPDRIKFPWFADRFNIYKGDFFASISIGDFLIIIPGLIISTFAFRNLFLLMAIRKKQREMFIKRYTDKG